MLSIPVHPLFTVLPNHSDVSFIIKVLKSTNCYIPLPLLISDSSVTVSPQCPAPSPPRGQDPDVPGYDGRRLGLGRRGPGLLRGRIRNQWTADSRAETQQEEGRGHCQRDVPGRQRVSRRLRGSWRYHHTEHKQTNKRDLWPYSSGSWLRSCLCLVLWNFAATANVCEVVKIIVANEMTQAVCAVPNSKLSLL